jgi:hypothetical protein
MSGMPFQESEAMRAVAANDMTQLDELLAAMDLDELLALVEVARMVADCAEMAARSR